jgi:hypothetical protein
MHGADRTGQQAASYVVPAPAPGAHHRPARLPRAADTDVVIEAVFASRGPMTVGLQAILTGIEQYHELLGPMHCEPAPRSSTSCAPAAASRTGRAPRNVSLEARWTWQLRRLRHSVRQSEPHALQGAGSSQSSRNVESARLKF